MSHELTCSLLEHAVTHLCMNDVAYWAVLVYLPSCLPWCGLHPTRRMGSPKMSSILSAVFYLLLFWLLPVAEAWALLLASLKSSCPKVQLEAAKAVWGLTGCPQQCKDAVVASGGLLHIGY